MTVIQPATPQAPVTQTPITQAPVTQPETTQAPVTQPPVDVDECADASLNDCDTKPDTVCFNLNPGTFVCNCDIGDTAATADWLDGNNEKVTISVTNGEVTMTTSTETLTGTLRDTTITVTRADGSVVTATITKGTDETTMTWDDPTLGGGSIKFA